MTVYIVGQAFADDGLRWDFQGVFDSEEKAIAACVDWCYGYGPAEMNEPRPRETSDWPGWHYPLQEAHAAGRCLPNCPCKATEANADA